MEKFEVINSIGNKVKAQIELPNNELLGSKIIVIACHGFGSDKNASTIAFLTDKLIKNGIGAVSFDFTGHGESDVGTEKISITNCIEDLKAVHRYVIENFKDSKIGVFASSFGAAVSLSYLLGTNANVDALVLRCPAVEMGYIIENVLANEDLKVIKDKGFTYMGNNGEMKIHYSFYEDVMKYNLYELYKEHPMKMLIIHGRKDDIAPFEHAQKLSEIHPDLAKLEIFEDADHRFKKDGEMDKLADISLKYFNEYFEK